MDIKCEITFNTESGDYNVRFQNITEPGALMDYSRMRLILSRIIQDFDERSISDAKHEDVGDQPVESPPPA
ncbi:MAG: hypothetical protein JW841_02345 [Deltaproteobacteria bacterium]|nr:hypothetical protein [Deltaproteobacteria bacterium]